MTANNKKEIFAISFNHKDQEMYHNNIVNDLANIEQPEEPKAEDGERREYWGSNAEFVLSCVGLSVGIGNVWRFPYLAYQNGGGAFLLPYVILLLLVGKPMYFLEVAFGQYSSLGPMSIWKCFPIAKGIGAAMVIVSLVVCIYYNVVMSYTIFYMAQSFRSVLPWSDCFEWWGANTSTCYVRSSNKTLCSQVLAKFTEDYLNNPYANDTVRIEGTEGRVFVPQDIYVEAMSNCTNATQTASEQFWERYVLDLSSGIDNIGIIKWDLALCVLASWTIVFLCLMKGIKSSGKVVYFTATFPYVVLISFLIYGVTLDGAIDGLKFFFVPNWDKVLEIQVWRRAAEQLFYSLSISWGGLILFGSFNRFENKVHRDAILVSALDFATSLISGIVIFSVLGNMAKVSGINIQDVVKQEQGLAFVAYPEALSRLWFPQLWNFLFFFMLFLLGVDTQFAYLETFLTALYDEKPNLMNYKTLIVFLTCATCFFISLSCVTQGGQYVFTLLDKYAGNFSVIFIAVCELIALMWGYGIRRLCDDLEFMLHFRPGIYLKASWFVISPLVLSFLFIYGMVEFSPVMYNNIKPYPKWADGIGWIFALVSMVQIPLWAIVILYRNRDDITKVFRPADDWGPRRQEDRDKREEVNQHAELAVLPN